MTELGPDTKEEFRALVEHTTDILSVLDEDGTIAYQTPSAERFLGYEQEELIGEVAFEYVHPEDRDRVIKDFAAVVTSEAEVGRVEFRFRTADGSWLWLEAIASNERHTALGGYVVTSRDISERKERERELALQNERLEEFANIVSHDLRNPLQVMEGSLDLFRETGEEEHFERCQDAIDRMNRLIRDLLVLSQDGETVRDPVPVALDDIASTVWETVDTATADLTVVDDPRIMADTDQLRQLLENLLKNAVSHGAGTSGSAVDAERTVSVTIGRTDSGFYVADDGPGIPAEQRDKVFEPGYSTSSSGTGYGLRIVDRIADAHGWTVDVTESTDGGARFEIHGVEFA